MYTQSLVIMPYGRGACNDSWRKLGISDVCQSFLERAIKKTGSEVANLTPGFSISIW
jgi:hypothetical protein